MIKDIFQRKTESSIPCESLQQLQRQQQASPSERKRKARPPAQDCQENGKGAQGVNKEEDPHAWEALRPSSPGWAWLTPRQSSGAPCQAPRLPPRVWLRLAGDRPVQGPLPEKTTKTGVQGAFIPSRLSLQDSPNQVGKLRRRGDRALCHSRARPLHPASQLA